MLVLGLDLGGVLVAVGVRDLIDERACWLKEISKPAETPSSDGGDLDGDMLLQVDAVNNEAA